MIYTDRLSISPLLNLIKQQFDLSFSSVSFLLTIYFLAYVGFTIPAAILAERFGYKRTMVASLLLAACSLALAGVFGTSYYLLLFFLGVHGMGAGAYFPTAFKISTASSPSDKRGASSAIIFSGIGLGTLLGLIIAGPIMAVFLSWQAVLILLAVPTVITVVLLHTLVIYKEETLVSNFRLAVFRQLFKNKDFTYICMALFCSLYGYWVILSWAPSLLQITKNLNVFYSGLATGIFAAIGIPSSLLFGRYSDKIGRRKIALLTVPLASLTMVVMALSTSLIVFLFAVTVYGVVGNITLSPVCVAWMGDTVSSESLGAALAVLNVIAMTSSIFAPVITGIFADATGILADGFYAAAAIVLLSAVFLFFVKKGRLH